MPVEIEKPDQIVERWLTQRTIEILRRYRKKHGLDTAHDVTVDMVRTHFYTERRLARDILAAAPACRAAVAEQAYTEFYTVCFWLDAHRNQDTERGAQLSFGPIQQILRRYGTKVYEVGSGSGHLAMHLARHSFDCVATDISLERKKLASRDRNGLVWHVSDGVNLARHEPHDHYDIVLSSQLVEHLHPDDIQIHCANAFTILKPGGAYVFNTPHRFTGPNDISEIFGMDRSQCFHFKEYTYTELSSILMAAGFRHLKAVYVVPKRIRAKISLIDHPLVSSIYLRALYLVESALDQWESRRRRRLLRVPAAVGLWRPEVFLVAIK